MIRPTSLLFVALAALTVSEVSGQVKQTDDSDNVSKEQTQREKVFSHRQNIAKNAKVAIDAKATTLHETPIYRYHEVVRGFHDGTTWMWKDSKGRPAMILNLSGKDRTFYEFISLTNSQLSCSINGFLWKPEAGWKPKAIPNAKEPTQKRVTRKLQMRAMAKKFTSKMIDVNSGRKEVIRMLPEPIFRYKQETETTLDGALFAFVRDGDLEVILTIEAEKDPKTGVVRWVFDCDRVCSSEQHVSFEDQEVWTCPRGFPGITGQNYGRYIRSPANSRALQ